MSCDVNIVVKLTYFRFDRLRSTKTHRFNMATIKTSMICNIRGSNDDWRVIGTCFDALVFGINISVRELLNFIFDAGSVVFN